MPDQFPYRLIAFLPLAGLSPVVLPGRQQPLPYPRFRRDPLVRPSRSSNHAIVRCHQHGSDCCAGRKMRRYPRPQPVLPLPVAPLFRRARLSQQTIAYNHDEFAVARVDIHEAPLHFFETRAVTDKNGKIWMRPCPARITVWSKSGRVCPGLPILVLFTVRFKPGGCPRTFCLTCDPSPIHR